MVPDPSDLPLDMNSGCMVGGCTATGSPKYTSAPDFQACSDPAAGSCIAGACQHCSGVTQPMCTDAGAGQCLCGRTGPCLKCLFDPCTQDSECVTGHCDSSLHECLFCGTTCTMGKCCFVVNGTPQCQPGPC
jgi:hypothetical protein